MDYLQLMYVLGLCSCFYCTKGEHVRFNTTRTVYNVGDNVTLTCYVRSSWLTVSFERNNSDLGFCSTIINRCASKDDVPDEHGKYELKLEKSRPMLVIKNVTRDDDGADFTCQWTSYTATISFTVTAQKVANARLTVLSSIPLGDIAVTTPSRHEKNTSNSSDWITEVLVILIVAVIVIEVAVAGAVVRLVWEHKCYSRIVRWFNDWQETTKRFSKFCRH